MTKKQIDTKTQAKFDKAQFNIGDSVYFSFLGQKQYGYVTKFKKTSWGIQYTVQSAGGSKYPCGICIKGIKTTYQTGIIFFEESIQTGSDECRRRYDTAKTAGTYVSIPADARRSKIKVGDNNTPSITDAVDSARKMDDNSRRRNRAKNDVEPSSNGVPSGNRKKRGNSKNSELTDAIQKQRDFLSGFVKKD